MQPSIAPPFIIQQAVIPKSLLQKSVSKRSIQSIVLPSIYAVADELPPDRPRKNTRRIGEIGGASFVLKAESLNFPVAKPWSQNNRYDFILDSGRRLSRVQLKCTASISGRSYQIKPMCSIHGKQVKEYTRDDIDFIVAYILPRDVWYVIPIEALKGITYLRFYPDIVCRHPVWEIYREAWYLLRECGEVV
jgi:hypothetical protein